MTISIILLKNVKTTSKNSLESCFTMVAKCLILLVHRTIFAYFYLLGSIFVFLSKYIMDLLNVSISENGLSFH